MINILGVWSNFNKLNININNCGIDSFAEQQVPTHTVGYLDRRRLGQRWAATVRRTAPSARAARRLGVQPGHTRSRTDRRGWPRRASAVGERTRPGGNA